MTTLGLISIILSVTAMINSYYSRKVVEAYPIEDLDLRFAVQKKALDRATLSLYTAGALIIIVIALHFLT